MTIFAIAVRRGMRSPVKIRGEGLGVDADRIGKVFMAYFCGGQEFAEFHEATSAGASSLEGTFIPQSVSGAVFPIPASAPVMTT